MKLIDRLGNTVAPGPRFRAAASSCGLPSRRPAWTTSTLLRFCPKAKARIDQSPPIVDQSAGFANPPFGEQGLRSSAELSDARHTHRECTRVMPGRDDGRASRLPPPLQDHDTSALSARGKAGSPDSC